MSEEFTDDQNEDNLPAVSEGGEDGLDPNYAAPTRKFSQGGILFFCVILIAGAAIYFMRARFGPAAAAASADEPAKQTINNFLNDGNRSIRIMQEMLRNTEKIVQQFKLFPSTNQVPLTSLLTNPFRFSAPVVDKAPDEEFIAKQKREAEHRAALAEVNTIKVQSIVHGAKSTCLINDNFYTVGDKVGALTIEKINEGSIIVKTGEWRFEVALAR